MFSRFKFNVIYLILFVNQTAWKLLKFESLWWTLPSLPSAGVTEQTLPSPFLCALEENAGVGDLTCPFYQFISAAIKSKKRGNTHLPSACLEESFTIATAQHGPHGWQVKTLYVLTVKAAVAEWTDLQACIRRVAEFYVCCRTLYLLKLITPKFWGTFLLMA